MYLAVKTTASPAETWAIVVVAVICLAFWLIMVVAIAPRPDARKRERQQALPVPFAGGLPVPVAGGTHVAAGGRSVAPSRDAPAMAMPGTPTAQDTGATGAGAQAVAQTRDDLPSVPGQREPAAPAPARPPAQRQSATDEAAPSRPPDR
jgi:hypothetical protein